ncbi:MAG: S1 family peptidase [Actinomycetia bacterium]|nr:S1 family peptidase [Actinomycetes bacterium]
MLAVLAASVVPAGAVTRGGELDGDDHSYVGLMVATIGGAPAWRCSGALISPTIYVTAGHCTFGADGAELWFASDLEPDPAGDHNYPFTGEVSGTPYASPDYIDAAFWYADVGVVVLDEPVDLDEYAELADVGAVDGLAGGRKRANIDAVGYGLQKIIANSQGPGDKMYQDDKTRYQATLMLVNTRGVAGIGPINPDRSFTMSGDAKHGGTCFGDSGGPILISETNQIVGVNSFGMNGNCAGIGGAYRVDSTDVQGWINSFSE